MAQITVPGSTAESTNVTPVSAEVPTGVTLPEQIDDFTAQTNAAEPSSLRRKVTTAPLIWLKLHLVRKTTCSLFYKNKMMQLFMQIPKK